MAVSITRLRMTNYRQLGVVRVAHVNHFNFEKYVKISSYIKWYSIET